MSSQPIDGPRAPAEQGKPLRCPYCGDEIDAVLEYSGFAHSEHRDHVGYECASYKCDAKWDRRGAVTLTSRLLIAADLEQGDQP